MTDTRIQPTFFASDMDPRSWENRSGKTGGAETALHRARPAPLGMSGRGVPGTPQAALVGAGCRRRDEDARRSAVVHRVPDRLRRERVGIQAPERNLQGVEDGVAEQRRPIILFAVGIAPTPQMLWPERRGPGIRRVPPQAEPVTPSGGRVSATARIIRFRWRSARPLFAPWQLMPSANRMPCVLQIWRAGD